MIEWDIEREYTEIHMLYIYITNYTGNKTVVWETMAHLVRLFSYFEMLVFQSYVVLQESIIDMI